MKNRIVQYVFMLGLLPASALDFSDLFDKLGSIFSLLSGDNYSAQVPTIAASQYGFGGGSGQIISNVNVYTGQPSYSISLGGISVRGVIPYQLSINYSGPVEAQFKNDNMKAPTSWAGMGWDISAPSIAVNNKGTVNNSDDVIMCSMGQFGGGQILQNSAGTFYLSSNPYIVITTQLGSGGLAGQIVAWTFQMQDGKKFVFGSNSNCQRTMNATNALVIASPFSTSTSKSVIYRWDLNSITDFSGTNTMKFTYKQEIQAVPGGRVYVRESHIRTIGWSGSGGEVERYEFITKDKATSEYVGYLSIETKDDQRTYETKYLDTLKCFKEGKAAHAFRFLRTMKPDWQNLYQKALLQEIQVFNYDRNGIPIKDKGWNFAYEDNLKSHLLNSVTTPEMKTETYTYTAPSFDGTAADDGIVPPRQMLLDDNKTPIRQCQGLAMEGRIGLRRPILLFHRTGC